MNRQNSTNTLTESCATSCAAICSVVLQYPCNLSRKIVIESGVAENRVPTRLNMNERTKKECVASWRGLAVQSAGTAMDVRHRLFVPFMVVEYILSCKLPPSVDPKNKLCRVLALAIASRRAPRGQRGCACATTTVATGASPSNSPALITAAHFVHSEVQMNKRRNVGRALCRQWSPNHAASSVFLSDSGGFLRSG